MILTRSADIEPVISRALVQACARIAAVLPAVEVHHIGSTAIPGALTKGDLDVVLRVDARDFDAAAAKLRTAFAVKQPENWTPHFASFGNDTDFDAPLGVQLVIKDSEADSFLFVRDYLIAHPGELAAYNRAKEESADAGAHDYWTAKDRILSRIVALK